MNNNNASDTAASEIGGAKFEALSAIGFTGKTDRECATEILIALINSRQVSGPEVSGAFLDIIQAIRKADVMPMPADDPAPAEEPVEQPTAAQIKKSITPDALISFIDGKPYKTLRRHLTTHGLTPEGYRARYGLDPDYPMVSPNYSAARSALAKKIGLGTGAKASA